MSDTTTDTPEETGAQVAQPESTEQVKAVEQQPATAEESTSVETEVTQETAEPSSDDNSEWFKSKGIDPTDPDAINKLAKSAREAERAMHSKSQKASELEKTMGEMSDSSAEQTAEATGQDPELLKRLQRIEVRDAKRDFFSSNPDASQYESQMAKIATEAGLYGSPESIMKAAYAMAKVSDSSLSTKTKQDTLKSLAQKQQSAVPQGNAVTTGSSPQEKEFGSLSISEMESKLGFAKQ
jgi:hypothetical protein